MTDSLSAARPGIAGKTGPGNAFQPRLPSIPGAGVAAFKSRPPAPFAQNRGPNPNIVGDRHLVFIPPLALFNDASQWVNKLMFNKPLAFNGNPNSNPPLRVQYFTPPPINTQNLGAGNRNVQLQLGNLSIQTARLTAQASNYYGG